MEFHCYNLMATRKANRDGAHYTDRERRKCVCVFYVFIGDFTTVSKWFGWQTVDSSKPCRNFRAGPAVSFCYKHKTIFSHILLLLLLLLLHIIIISTERETNGILFHLRIFLCPAGGNVWYIGFSSIYIINKSNISTVAITCLISKGKFATYFSSHFFFFWCCCEHICRSAWEQRWPEF